MGLGEAFDAVTDWAMEGSTFSSLAKFTGVSLAAAGVLLGVLAAPFIYVADSNERAFKNELVEMDKRPTAIFNSVADCMNQGFDKSSCEASQQKAMDVAGSLGTSVSYSSGADCEKNHQSCEAKTTTTTSFIMAGKVMVPVTTTSTSYYPHIVGWEAERDNLDKAVPLYQGPAPGQAMRGDGKILTLDVR